MNFYELGIEVVRCLSAHGTVVAMVGLINVTDRNLGSVQYASRATKLKHDRNLNSPTPPPTLENSLDWLDQGFLESTRLDVIHTKPTGGISWNLKESRYYHLRHAIRQYWNPVGGVTQDPRNVYGQISHPLREPDRWDRPAGDINCKAFVLATGKHSRLPVSIAIDYLSLGGLLVVIPPILSPSEGVATEVTKLAILDLKDLCQDLLEIMQVQVPTERPEWVLRHRAPRAKDITKEITDGENRTAELQEELSPYDQMLSLIDGTGSNLVDAVAGVFDRASEAIRVELTEKAAPLDLFVYDGTGRSLAVEVTGVKGNLGKDDPPLGGLPRLSS